MIFQLLHGQWNFLNIVSPTWKVFSYNKEVCITRKEAGNTLAYVEIGANIDCHNMMQTMLIPKKLPQSQSPFLVIMKTSGSLIQVHFLHTSVTSKDSKSHSNSLMLPIAKCGRRKVYLPTLVSLYQPHAATTAKEEREGRMAGLIGLPSLTELFWEIFFS